MGSTRSKTMPDRDEPAEDAPIPAEDEPEPDWAVLRDPSGAGVNVSLQVVPEPRVGKNRLHLDLYTRERDAEVDRLLGLGATRHPRTPEPDEDFIVLADPEGNLFCLIQKGG